MEKFAAGIGKVAAEISVRQPLKVSQATVVDREICPYCEKEIGEKSVYQSPDGYIYHRGCQKSGAIGRSDYRYESGEGGIVKRMWRVDANGNEVADPPGMPWLATTEKQEKRAYVEPLPRWKREPERVFSSEFQQQPGVQNLMRSLLMQFSEDGRVVADSTPVKSAGLFSSGAKLLSRGLSKGFSSGVPAGKRWLSPAEFTSHLPNPTAITRPIQQAAAGGSLRLPLPPSPAPRIRGAVPGWLSAGAKGVGAGAVLGTAAGVPLAGYAGLLGYNQLDAGRRMLNRAFGLGVDSPLEAGYDWLGRRLFPQKQASRTTFSTAAENLRLHRQPGGEAATMAKDALSDSEVVAAGLAVKASDTGRVLLLQRALDDADPASGTWEFPGGHVEPGESPLSAAKREWREETGASLPTGEVTGTWEGGIYRGHVWKIPEEKSVRINALPGKRKVLNPDDPDQDQIEVVAWWLPEQLKGLPVLRQELKKSMRGLQAALGEAAGKSSA